MAIMDRCLRMRLALSSFSSHFLCARRRYSSTAKVPPLRILFAGSDNFSSTSLSALHRAHVSDPSLIASIDVLCREDGRTGRKRDILKEGTFMSFLRSLHGSRTDLTVPIKAAARNLELPLHTISTFEDFQVPSTTLHIPYRTHSVDIRHSSRPLPSISS